MQQRIQELLRLYQLEQEASQRDWQARITLLKQQHAIELQSKVTETKSDYMAVVESYRIQSLELQHRFDELKISNEEERQRMSEMSERDRKAFENEKHKLASMYQREQGCWQRQMEQLEKRNKCLQQAEHRVRQQLKQEEKRWREREEETNRRWRQKYVDIERRAGQEAEELKICNSKLKEAEREGSRQLKQVMRLHVVCEGLKLRLSQLQEYEEEMPFEGQSQGSSEFNTL